MTPPTAKVHDTVPDDIAVIGFDNWEILAGGARPPLTSIDMNLEEVGRAAARALFAALDGSPAVGCGGAAVPRRPPRLDRPAGLAAPGQKPWASRW